MIIIILILILSIILLLLSYFLYIQKNKVMLLQQQIGDLKNKMSILEKQELAAEQHNNFLRQEANTVHLYASLSLQEARKTSIKDKQSQIIRSSEHILELLNSEKVWGCCKCKLIAGNSLFPYAKYAYLSEEFCLRQ